MVNGKDKIFVEKSTGIEETGDSFYSAEALEGADKENCRKRSTESLMSLIPYLMPDLRTARVNGVYKKHSLKRSGAYHKKISQRGAYYGKACGKTVLLAGNLPDFLKACVEAGLNIFISRGTSSGKTTFLNCLADYIPPDERLVVIEGLCRASD